MSSLRILIISVFMVFQYTTSINRIKRQWPMSLPFPPGQSLYPGLPLLPSLSPFSSFPMPNYGLPSLYNSQNLPSDVPNIPNNIPTSSNNQFQKISVPAGSTIYIFGGGGETKYSAPGQSSTSPGLSPFSLRPSSVPNHFPNNNNINPFESMFSSNPFPGLYHDLHSYPQPPPPFPPNVLNNWISNPFVNKATPPPTPPLSQSPWTTMQEIFKPLLTTLANGPNTVPLLTIPTTIAPVLAPSPQSKPVSSPPNNLTICEKETKSLNCPDNKRLKVIAATFGRQMWYICDPSLNLKLPTQCVSGNTLENVLGRCEGKPSCSLTADSQLGGGSDPCPGIAKYLTVLYDCII